VYLRSEKRLVRFWLLYLSAQPFPAEAAPGTNPYRETFPFVEDGAIINSYMFPLLFFPRHATPGTQRRTA
jgi:hypothetical protein